MLPAFPTLRLPLVECVVVSTLMCDIRASGLGHLLRITILSRDRLLLIATLPLMGQTGTGYHNNNLARHRVVPQITKCINYLVAGILWERLIQIV